MDVSITKPSIMSSGCPTSAAVRKRAPAHRLGMSKTARPVESPVWFRFEPREIRDVVARPFDGLVMAQWERGNVRASVIYDDGSWWAEVGPNDIYRCRSICRALRIFWRYVRQAG